MHVFRNLCLAVAIVGVSACGSDDPTAPDLDVELDPATIEARVNEAVAIYDHPALASFAQLGGGSPAVTSISRSFDRTAGIVGRVRRTLQAVPGARRPLRSTAVSAAVGEFVPVELEGNSYVWDAVDGWVLDGRGGAPADGIRFIIPGLDELGEPTDAEIGHLDVRDLGTTTSDRIVATLVAGGRTLVSLEMRDDGDEANYVSTIDIVVTDGASRIEFADVNSVTANSPEDFREVETVQMTTNLGLGYRSSWIWSGARANDVEWEELTVGRATIRFSWRMVYDALDEAWYSGDEADISVNGRLYARERYDDALGVWVFEDANGEPLSEADVDQLYGAYYMTDYLYELVFIPLLVMENWVGSVAGVVIQ